MNIGKMEKGRYSLWIRVYSLGVCSPNSAESNGQEHGTWNGKWDDTGDYKDEYCPHNQRGCLMGVTLE